jgi:cytochrome b6-f complex subunit 5
MLTTISYFVLLIAALISALVLFIKNKLSQFLTLSLLVKKKMVEALLSGIVLGLIPITLAGLFVTAYLQYRRGDQLDL